MRRTRSRRDCGFPVPAADSDCSFFYRPFHLSAGFHLASRSYPGRRHASPLAHVGVAVCRLSRIAQVAQRGRDLAAMQLAVRLHIGGDLMPEAVGCNGRLPSRPLWLEVYERRGGGALILFLPPGARPSAEFISLPISKEDLTREYVS
jgi:hypothetical protein